ncbi:MAG: DUF4838 domain-containing protein [Armatimonadota bacterium]
MRCRHAVQACATLAAATGLWLSSAHAQDGAGGTEVISIGGELRPVVVRAEDGSRAPAQQLVAYLSRITGAALRLNAPTPEGRVLTILVGRGPQAEQAGLDFDALHPYGYLIRLLGGDTLVLGGRNATADGYAIFDFLKRFCGYRWLMPGELGEIVPSRQVINLPATIDITEAPALTSYTNAGLYGGNAAYLRSWRTTLLASHWMSRIYPPARYAAEHPEYYTLVDGRRFVPPPELGGTWQPCVSNPELPPIAVAYAAQEWFPATPEALGLPAGVNDGGGDCHCPQCTASLEHFGNQYVPFYNALGRLAAQHLPGKLVCFIAYGGAAGTPRNIQLEPNLYVEVCNGLRDNFRLMREWQRAGAQHIGLYDYLYGGGYVVPRHYPHIMGQAWKTAYRQYGLTGAWTETFTQVWLYDGPRQYVLNTLAWDIDADVDALLDDYFAHCYGEAAAPMRRLFDRIEQVYARKPDPLHPMADWKRLSQLAEYTREDVRYLRDQLVQAEELASHPAVIARLALFRRIFGLSELYLRSYLAGQELGEIRSAGPADAESILRLASEGLRAAEGIHRYSMTEAEEQAIFTNTTLEGYRGEPTLRPGTVVEREADRVLGLISERMMRTVGVAAARTLWEGLTDDERYRPVAPLLRTQVYLLHHPGGGPNLIQSPSFEPAEGVGAQVLTDAELERFDWWRLDERLPGWSTWHFQQSVTRFVWDGEQAHSGTHSLCVRENQIAGCFQTAVPVTPGTRYRLSFWVKQQPPDRGGAMSIRWMRDGAWADQGERAVPRIEVEYPRAPESRWRAVEVTFTAPEGVTTCLPLLSAPRQGPDEAIWFDDVSMVMICPAREQ